MAGQRARRNAERAEYDSLDPAKQHAPQTAAAIVSAYVDGSVLAGASATSRALVTWRRIAGKRAAKHTVAVWLSEPKRATRGERLPELVVYLDGNALMADLATNAELYVERLAYAGLHVSAVKFRLSRKAGQRPQPAPPAKEPAAPTAPALPALTAYERASVDAACEKLPDRLRASASEARKMSLRRHKLETTGNGQPQP